MRISTKRSSIDGDMQIKHWANSPSKLSPKCLQTFDFGFDGITLLTGGIFKASVQLRGLKQTKSKFSICTRYQHFHFLFFTEMNIFICSFKSNSAFTAFL